MKSTTKIIGVFIIVFIFGSILVFKGLGMWKTESEKQPIKFQSGEFAGENNPDDIRGSYTFEDIQSNFDVSAETLANAFGVVTEEPTAFQVKELEEIYSGLEGEIEIGTASVRFFVALYTGLPYATETYITETAFDILKNEGKITEELADSLESKGLIINISKSKLTALTEQRSNSDTEAHDEVFAIKGKTTVREALDAGIPLEEIEKLIGSVPNKNMVIRDTCIDKGIEFSSVKEALTALLN